MFAGRIARAARAMAFMLVAFGALAACGNADDRVSFEDLSANEVDSLYAMREEEKLARDVYRALYATWPDAVFANIADSEQAHVDAVKALIDKYNLIDPAIGNPPGVFTDPRFQQLYDQLVAFGTRSRIDALAVGVQIEELDIKDIAGWLAVVERSDIIGVYTSLACGSRNHLRSFHAELVASGGSYLPKYITQAEFDAIVSSPMETCG